MAGILQHLRSSTLDKRPNPASMVDGQVAINYASGSPGMFFKDSNGDLVKVGPVHVGTTAPNVSPASGGTAGNSKGEQWLDTSGGTYVFKIWDGSAWRSEAGEFVNSTGDTMTGSLTMGQSANIIFEGSVDDGFETTLTVANPTADRTITLPNVTGTVVTTGDSGSVTSAMIANGTIVDADVNASAAIAGTKVSPNFGSQTVQTTGIFSAAGGSASAPSIAFTGDTNTGIYSPGANQLALSTNGTGKLFIDSAGKVTVKGVGTAAFVVEGSAPDNSLVIKDSTGNVGIGTSSPGSPLTIGGFYTATSNMLELRTTNGGIDGGGRILWKKPQDEFVNAYISSSRVGAGITAQIEFGTSSSIYVQDATTKMTITGAGNVGIGTTSPQAKLDVQGIAKISTPDAANVSVELGGGATGDRSTFIDFVGDTTYTDYGLRVIRNGGANGGSTFVTRGTGALTFQGSESSPFVFVHGPSTERARIDSSGRLLVGTSSARTNLVNGTLAAQLQVEGINHITSSASLIRNSADASNAFLTLGKTRGTANGSNTIVQNNDGLGTLAFLGADGTNLIRAAQISAEVDGTPGANDMPGRLVFSTTADGASSPTERLRIDSAGRLLHGTTNTSPAVNNVSGAIIAGTGYAEFSQQAFTVLFLNRKGGTGTVVDIKTDGTTVGTISVTTTATAYNTSSDYRLKENVTPVTDGITRLQQLKPSRFNFIADPDKTVDGFLAHEVQTIVPEAITGEKDAVDDEGNPQYQGIDQSKLVPLLTAALQEAIGRIETLEAEVAALKAS